MIKDPMEQPSSDSSNFVGIDYSNSYDYSGIGLGEDFERSGDWFTDWWDPNHYQHQLNKYQMIREDNAYQRKVRDLKLAGLNPILAVEGSGSPSSAGSSNVNNTVGNVFDKSALALQKVMNFKAFKKDLQMKDEQINSIIANINQTEAETARTEALTKQIEDDKNLSWSNTILSPLVKSAQKFSDIPKIVGVSLGNKTYKFFKNRRKK